VKKKVKREPNSKGKSKGSIGQDYGCGKKNRGGEAIRKNKQAHHSE